MKIQVATVAIVLSALALNHFTDQSAPVLPTQAAVETANPREQLKQRLKERYETAKALLDLEEKRLEQGVTTLSRLCEAARWVRDSALDLPVSTEERMSALTNYVALTRRLEAGMNRAAESGAAPLADRESAHYLRLDAEVTLLRAQLSRP